MTFAIGPGLICGVVMSLMVEAKDQEDDGLWNHLFLSKNTPQVYCGKDDQLLVSGEVRLSWSQVKDEIPFKEGEFFRARITADCDSGRAIDEDMSDRTNSWVSYRVWTCDVTQIEVLE